MKTITEGEISSTATFKKRYGIPQRKPSKKKRPQPALVNKVRHMDLNQTHYLEDTDPRTISWPE